MKKLITVSLLLFLVSFVCKSQETFELTELPDDYSVFYLANHFVIDADGNKWIGRSGYGLLKFNDTGFTQFSILNSEIPSNRIESLYSYDGLLYVGTDAGLGVFDGENWTVYNNQNGLPDNSVISIFKKGDKLYVGTLQGGLAIFDGSGWSVLNKTNSDLTSNKVVSICEGNDGDVWFATGNYNSQQTGALHKLEGDEITTFTHSEIMPGASFFEILSILKGKNSKIVINTNRALLSYNGTGFLNIGENFEWELPGNSTGFGWVKNMEYLYVSKENYVYLIKGGKLNVYPSGKFKDAILIDDNEGNIWFANSSLSKKYVGIFKPENYLSLYDDNNNPTPENYKYLNINKVKAGYHNS